MSETTQTCKKKLLFVINTLSAAGAEKSFLELLRGIDPEVYETDVYVLLAQGELRAQLPPYVRLRNRTFCDQSVLAADGQRHLKKQVLRAGVRRMNGLRQLPYLIRMAAAMKKNGNFSPDKLLWQLVAGGAQRLPESYDLAVAYLEGGSAYYVADAVQAKKKVAFFHSDYARSGYTRELDRDCYLKFDHVFTVSEEGTAHFLEVYPQLQGRVSLFHNPLDLKTVLARSREPISFPAWTDYEGVHLLSVGRLIPLKAFDVAVEAMRLLKEQGIAARWYVLGEGGERPRLEQMIREYGLQQEFWLAGAVDNPYPYYAGCDLYIHISHYEGRSVAIQEAQALGCAVLASDCSGNREQITDGEDGVLVEVRAQAVAAQIARLLADQKLRCALGARAAEKPSSYPQDIAELLSYAQQSREEKA